MTKPGYSQSNATYFPLPSQLSTVTSHGLAAALQSSLGLLRGKSARLRTLGIWAALCFGGGLYASWLGYGGREFAATLTAFACLLCRDVALRRARRAGISFVAFWRRRRLPAGHGGHSWIPDLRLRDKYFCVRACRRHHRFGVHSVGVWRRRRRSRPPGAWQDYVTIAGVWVAVKFSPSHWLWPYPGGRLAYVFTVLLCVNVALATFLLVRRLGGVGYSIGWGPRGAL